MPAQRKALLEIPPIAQVAALASVLGITHEQLIFLSENADTLWKPGKRVPKKGGGFRDTIDAREPLKTVHERIKNRLLKRVRYPDYLKGGIAGGGVARDYKAHAAAHAGSRICFSEDIENFFPNTDSGSVRRIWQYFFCFSPEVSEILANITTLNGWLPQGWKPSSYLANLVFWEYEPELAEQLRRRGFVYTRYMDDITVSTRNFVNGNTKTFVVTAISQMLRRAGYKQKRSKHDISSSRDQMQVTGLNVNAGRPTMPKSERNKLRAMVHQCEEMFQENRNSPEYASFWNKVSGKVGNLKRFHPQLAAKYRARLNIIAP